MLFFEICGVVAVFVDEDGSAIVVQGFPEEGLLGEAKDEEIAGCGALSEHVGDWFDI